MKKILSLLLVMALVCLTNSTVWSASANSPSKTQKRKAETQQTLAHLATMDYKELKDLKVKDWEEKAGRKLRLKEKIFLGMAKKQAQKFDRKVQKGKAQPNEFKFNIGGFLLGFFLGLIGLLITLAFKDQKNALISAAIGIGVLLVIVLLIAAA
jgi:hypothetical protein